MRVRWLFSGICCFGLWACQPAGESSLPMVDDSQGPLLLDWQGQPFNFSDFSGRWVVLNYWADWCPPCVYELPELEAFHQAYAPDLAVVVGVSWDLDESLLPDIVKRHRISYNILPVSQDPLQRLPVDGVSVLPTTFIINPEGQLVARLVGEQTQESLLQAIEFRSELGEDFSIAH